MQTTMTTHAIVPRDEWLAARAVLLEREKQHTQLGDDLARQRRELPWVRLEKQYRLRTASGSQTLAELFDGCSQLLVYHFMFGPSYADGCPVNSSIADAFDSLIPHLNARDVTLIAVSGAPIEKLLAYRERMGWSFNWASSSQSDFNADLGFSSSLEQTREAIEPMLADLPPVAFRNAKKAGTDIPRKLKNDSALSRIEFCRTATIIPIGIASIHEKNILANERITVFDARAAISPVTLTR